MKHFLQDLKKLLGDKNYEKIIAYSKNIDSDELQQIADTLDPLVGERLPKKIKEIKKKKKKGNRENREKRMEQVLFYWYLLCKDDVEENMQSKLTEAFKSNIQFEFGEKHNDITNEKMISQQSPEEFRKSNEEGTDTGMAMIHMESKKIPKYKRRQALLIGNTYADSTEELEGCRGAVDQVGEKFRELGFEATIKTNQTKDGILDDMNIFMKQLQSCNLDTVMFYFCGHGGHSAGQVKSKGGLDQDSDDSDSYDIYGGDIEIGEGGDYFVGEHFERILTGKLIKMICEGTSNVKFRVIVFDCCRGKNKQEMGSQKVRLKINPSETSKMKNASWKNTFVFNSTLRHSVAWCGPDTTFFAKHFVEFAGKIDIDRIHIKINQELQKANKKKPKKHTQKVNFDQHGILDEFKWNIDDVSSIDDEPLVPLPPASKSPSNQDPNVFPQAVPIPKYMPKQECNDWIDETQKPRTQDEVNKTHREMIKMCEENVYPTISCKAMLKPKDDDFWKYWSICLDEETEFVARTVAYPTVRIFGQENFSEENIEYCVLCKAAFVFHDVYVCMVYKHSDDLFEQTKHKDSMLQCCLYHFVDFGQDNGRRCAGQKRKRTKD